MKTENHCGSPLTDQELATVLAALRYYQAQGLADDPRLRSDAIHDIATGGEEANFVASLDGAGIDALCERLNLGQPTEKPKPTHARITRRMKLAEPVTGQLYAPNGKRIFAAKDWVPGNALIQAVTLQPDGTLEIEWSGETQLCWDGQHTEEYRGQRIFLDEDAREWREKQLTLRAE